MLTLCVLLPAPPVAVMVENGQGSGYYSPGEKVRISAPAAEGLVFDRWVGGKGYITNPYQPHTTLTVPDTTLHFRALYRDNDSTGIGDVDALRRVIHQQPTTAENAANRRTILYRWWRLLWRQGYDLTAFDDVAEKLLIDDDDTSAGRAAIDEGFAVLETLTKKPVLIPELTGKATAEEGVPTNWPRFYGPEGKGQSPDAGPSEGVEAWRFAKGYHWTANPVIEDGKVYLSSPGIDVMAFCLDQRTGQVYWRGRQFGRNFYDVHSSRWDPVVTADKVMIRTAYEPKYLKILDKATGQLVKAPKTTQEAPATAYQRLGRTLVLADATTGEDRWTYQNEAYWAGEPQVVGDKVYAADRSGRVYAFTTAQNRPEWKTDTGVPLRGSVTVGEKYVYAGGDEQTLFALDRETGTQVWTFDATRLESRAGQFFSEVAEADGRLYVGAANQMLYCLDAEDGHLIWEKELTDWVRAKPLLIGSTVYIATLDGNLTALQDQGDTATERWTSLVSEHGTTADLVGDENGILVACRDMVLYAVAPETGNLLWRHGIVDGVWRDDQFFMADWSGGLLGSPVVVDSVVYIGGPDGFVNAVAAESGEELWRFETNSTVSIAPTVAEDMVFFGYLGANTEHYGYDHPGEYFAVNKNTGEPVWQTTRYGRVWVGAAYADSTLFFGNTDGYVFAVDPPTGQERWSYYTAQDTPKESPPADTLFRHGYPPGVYSVPVKDDQHFYTGSWAGYYYSFDQQTGQVVWRTKTAAQPNGGLPDSAAPLLWKNHLYVQKFGGRIAALDKQDGAIAWEWTVPRGYLQNATVGATGNRIFGSMVRKVTELPYDAKMIAFQDVEAGSKILWEYPDVGGLTAPVLTGDKLIVGGSTTMFLTCLNPADGSLKWRYFMGGEMLENVPAIYGNKVFALSKNGYLHAIK